MQLTWALVIATYKRRNILSRCLRLAANQSRPPVEIIVVDSSPDWEASRDEILASPPGEVEKGSGPTGTIRWVYRQAERRSSAAQRNQGIRLATADVLFLIDDDSLMYPDCAQRIMEIYETDEMGEVAGVNAMHVPIPPDIPGEPAAPKQSVHGTTRHYGLLARLVRELLRAEDLFVPYDEDFPSRPLPPALDRPEIGTRRLMAGWGMTFRRSVSLAEPFEEIMTHYASGEDSDMSYRASRRGLLLTALEGRLCHIGASGGRMPGFVVAALGSLNPLVLHRIYSTDLNRSMRKSRLLLLRRACIGFFKDLSRGQLSVPNVRGILFALRAMPSIFARDEHTLRQWYPAFQMQLIDRWATPGT